MVEGPPPYIPPQPSVSPPVLTLEFPPRAAKGVTLVGLAGEGRSHLLDTSLVPGCEDAVTGPPGRWGRTGQWGRLTALRPSHEPRVHSVWV